MNIALLLKSELRRSAGILAGMALIIALALSIAVAAGICERMVKASAAQSADDFDLLIGARGSSSALLLGTVFLRDEMLPIVPASAWANIREAQTAKSSIRWAAPVAFGDRIPSGRTIVGTTRSFLDRGKSREPAAGRFFTKPTEAVAGASSGYVIGDKFSPMHGRVHGAGHAHEGIAYEVVGILPPTGTPWDRAVMVPIESVWAAHADAHGDHDHDHEAEEAHDREQPSAHLFESWMLSNKTHLEELPGFSAVIVKPASVSSAYRLRQRFNEIDAAGHDGKIVPLMGVFSAEVLVNLYAAFGGASQALAFVCLLTSIVALAAVLLASVLLGRLRLPTILLLRTLGAPRRYAAALTWSIVMTAATAGILGSLILGWGAAELCAGALELETGARITPSFSMREIWLALTALAAGAVCALLPAWLAGRMKLS